MYVIYIYIYIYVCISTYIHTYIYFFKCNFTEFSEWERISTDLLEGSILGSLLLKIFLNDLFLFVSNSSLSNKADDNTLCITGDNLKKIKDNLRSSFDTVQQWLYKKYVVLNAKKCHFMFLGKKKLKAKHSYLITSSWKIAKNKKLLVLSETTN